VRHQPIVGQNVRNQPRVCVISPGQPGAFLSFAHLLPKNNAFQRHFFTSLMSATLVCVCVCVVVVVVVAQSINSILCQCCSLSTQTTLLRVVRPYSAGDRMAMQAILFGCHNLPKHATYFSPCQDCHQICSYVASRTEVLTNSLLALASLVRGWSEPLSKKRVSVSAIVSVLMEENYINRPVIAAALTALLSVFSD
jgi:hypothetical protein